MVELIFIGLAALFVLVILALAAGFCLTYWWGTPVLILAIWGTNWLWRHATPPGPPS
jgi:hypothetical protein